MPSQSPSRNWSRLLAGIAPIVVIVAFLVGRLSVAGPAALALDDSPAAATVTRQAEQTELAALRTQVAQTPPMVVCTPAATSTPKPTETASPTATVVPPQPANQPVAYGDDWTVTVTGVSLMPTSGPVVADGVYARVTFTIENLGTDSRRFEFFEFVLRDERGRAYTLDPSAMSAFDSGFSAQYRPSIPVDGYAIFDIAADAQGPFILESATDPFFRVLVEVEVRG